jgi:hypothetical protein
MTSSLQLLAGNAVAAPESVVPEIDWRAFVVETVTGRVVGDIPYVGTPRHSSGLNLTGDLTINVPVGGNAIDKGTLRSYLDPWRFSLGLAWGAHIFQCGPIVTYQTQDSRSGTTVQVGCAGVWSLWTLKRVLANPSWTGTDITDVTADTVFTNLSLHTIAKRLIQNDLTRNGGLPIALPADIAGTESRTYPGYDIATVGERLGQLTQGLDAPEIEFRPRFTDATRTQVEWEMRIGNPRLGNLGLPHAWDYGQALTDLSEAVDASRQQFRSFVRGNGMERGLLTAVAEDTSLTDVGWPMLESVDGSHTSVTVVDDLSSWAQANVLAYRNPVRTWSAEVRIDGTNGRNQVTGSPSIHLVSAGDTAVFQVKNHSWIRDGQYGQRIIGIQSGQSASTVSLVLQAVSA